MTVIIGLKEILNRYPRLKQVARRMAACVPLPIRLGKRFWDWYTFFEESQSWTEDQLCDFQLEHLKLLLSEVTRTSVFYRQRLETTDVDGISSLEEFYAKIPTLTRGEFRDNYAQILNASWQDQRPVRSQTSGTTGMALEFYHSADDKSRQWAALCHQWKRVGYDPSKSRVAKFLGLTTSKRLIDVYPEQNMLRCSVLHMQPEHIQYYAEAIRKHHIDFYHVYPSALTLLCKVIHDSRISFPQPAAILLASEMVYAWQLDQMRMTFPDAKLYAHYGCAERTVLAGWCEYREEYHVLPQYAIVEVDPRTSEVIGTNLYNTINGFIRYRMTDTALDTKIEPCPDCGRAYLPRLSKLAGRTEDFLYSPKNGWIPPVIIDYLMARGLKIVRETQFWQKERDLVIIRYSVKSENNPNELEKELRHIAEGINHHFGEGVAIQFERVEDFPRDSSGKFKWIVSELEGPFYDQKDA